jgi:transposase
LSGVNTIETDQRFSGRKDFWIIVAARSEDETEIGAGKAAGGRRDQGDSARNRRHSSAEEKIRVVLEGLRGEASIAELCRREGIASSMCYGWSKEFLEARRRAPLFD